MTTARQLAERLEVSVRTVYRDVNDLMLSGVPIEGEAGVGYMLRRGFDIPPLMFTREEIEALVVGARLVRAWTGSTLIVAAGQALAKIEAVLPEGLRDEIGRSRVFAPDFHVRADLVSVLDRLHQAINLSRVIHFDYTREDGKASSRDVRPLGLFFWGSVWTLAAWCELRQAFRSFRVDRMAGVTVLERSFDETPGTGLNDFLCMVCQAQP